MPDHDFVSKDCVYRIRRSVFSLRVNEDPERRLVIRPVEGCYIGKPRGEDLEYCMNGQFSVDVELVISSRLVCQ